MNGVSGSASFVWSKSLRGLFADADLLTSAAPLCLFLVSHFAVRLYQTLCFEVQHKKKKEQQHHLFVVAHLSVTWNTPRREKVEFPAELSALKLARTRGAPGLLKARPQFYLFPCYFRIRARVLFFFLFVLRKCLLPLCCHTALNSKRETRRRNCSWWLCGENQPTIDWKRRSKFTPNLKQLRKANNLKGAFVSQPPW